MRALVVDDSRAIRRIIGDMLIASGFEVTEAKHGREALERLASEGCPAFATIDWNMPEMNGYEFVVAARALPAYQTMKILMVTTETEIGQIQKALDAGANEYIMKPFTKDVLLEKLALLGIEHRSADAA